MEKPSMYESVPQHDGTDSTVDDQDDTPLFRQDLRRRCCVSYLKYGTILVLYLLAYSVVVVSITLNVAASKRRIGQRFLKTPVDNSYIVYELRVMEQWEDRGGSPITYFAEPSEHIDKHWHDLFQYQNIGLDPELMKAVGREYEGIKLPDGTYYDLVMVFHHLHCIKNLCHALNPEYYGLVNMTVEEKASWNEHTSPAVVGGDLGNGLIG
ncbi:MAG: hypothetical protein M1818_004900 [Claussenomyces sp. TS43310]|nr:MAG: hypothetical protein M1818_004900 [Claussenomyces sp. TS43310]